MGRGTVSDQGNLASLAADTGLPNRGQKLTFRNLVFESVKLLVLDKTDRVIAPNRAL